MGSLEVITSVTGARSGTGGAALLGAPDPRCNEPNLCGGGGGACRWWLIEPAIGIPKLLFVFLSGLVTILVTGEEP